VNVVNRSRFFSREADDEPVDKLETVRRRGVDELDLPEAPVGDVSIDCDMTGDTVTGDVVSGGLFESRSSTS
jgi:hypothetical protein